MQYPGQFPAVVPALETGHGGGGEAQRCALLVASDQQAAQAGDEGQVSDEHERLSLSEQRLRDRLHRIVRVKPRHSHRPTGRPQNLGQQLRRLLRPNATAVPNLRDFDSALAGLERHAFDFPNPRRGEFARRIGRSRSGLSVSNDEEFHCAPRFDSDRAVRIP